MVNAFNRNSLSLELKCGIESSYLSGTQRRKRFCSKKVCFYSLEAIKKRYTVLLGGDQIICIIDLFNERAFEVMSHSLKNNLFECVISNIFIHSIQNGSPRKVAIHFQSIQDPGVLQSIL